jgi:hypothetical protein
VDTAKVETYIPVPEEVNLKVATEKSLAPAGTFPAGAEDESND